MEEEVCRPGLEGDVAGLVNDQQPWSSSPGVPQF